MASRAPAAAWVGCFAAALAWSAVSPHDYFTWVLEVTPALIALVVLAATRARFPLTPIAYLLILAHAVVLMVGGHYTYAEVPLFDWIAQATGSARNNYDKVGHFAQGFVPAVVAREVLTRLGVVTRPRWRDLLVVAFCLAVSAFYELVEWWVAVLTGDSAEAFLGTQGYAWDTQSDMGMALLGAVLAVLAIGRVHDRQMRAMAARG